MILTALSDFSVKSFTDPAFLRVPVEVARAPVALRQSAVAAYLIDSAAIETFKYAQQVDRRLLVDVALALVALRQRRQT